METFVLKQPPEISLTGNPMAYTLAVSPYGQQQRSEDIRVSVSVHIENNIESGSFTEVKTQTFYPDNDGMINFDVRTIIDAYLEYYTPPPNLDKPVQCIHHRKRYRISWVLLKDAQPASVSRTSDILYALKGGMAYAEWHPYDFFSQVIGVEKKPLNFFAAGEKVRLDDKRFLFWTYPFNDNDNQIFIVVIRLDNGDDIPITLPTTVFCNKWGVCCMPVGFNALGLMASVPPGNWPVSYSVTISSNLGVVVAPVTYTIDHRNFYEPTQLLYRNSLGAIETITVTGQKDFEAEYTRQNAQRVVPPSYYDRGLIVYPKAIQADIEEQPRIKGNTGFMKKAEAKKQRDLLLSQQVFELYNGKLLPVTLNNKNTKFFASNENALISLELEWVRPANSFFTPDNMMPPFGSIAVCPSVESIRVMKIAKRTVQVWWNLKVPYDRVEMLIVMPMNFSPPKEFSYSFDGNTGSKVLTWSFTQLKDGAVYDPNKDIPDNLTVQARTVCDENAIPPSVGAWTTVSLSNENELLPVAVNDVYQINSGFNTPQTLSPSVLANDYDPSSNALEVVAASGTTAQGGTFTIDTNGIITYQPIHSSFAGPDSFTYQLHAVGDPRMVTGNVTINVGVAPNLNFYYVKQVVRNRYDFNLGTSSYSEGEIWLDFFKDAAGTIPFDITALPDSSIEWKQKTRIQERTGVVTNSEETNSQLSVAGDKLKVFEGRFYQRSYFIGYPAPYELNVDIVITPTSHFAII